MTPSVVEDPRPIDGTLWGAWVRAGNDRWEVVRRSWSVFSRNTTELIDLLNVPATNIVVSLQLMGDDHDATNAFWEQLDQRLHNQIASAATLVDHVRRLLNYYTADVPALVEEYKQRNAAVTDRDETAYLRDLRNYLLHYGVPPVIQTLSLGSEGRAGAGHNITLSAERLLEWPRWSAKSRRYLGSFPERDGPILGPDVATYADAMREMFVWLFDQRAVIHRESIPDRFRIGQP